MQEEYSYRFDLKDQEAWLAHLSQEGYAVIRQIITPAEVKEVCSLFWDWLQQLQSGVDRNAPETWANNCWPAMKGLGFSCTYGGCHTKASWYLRCHPRVQAAFQKIWKSENLITSFDTTISWRPWWVGKGWNPTVENLHLDQNPFFKKGFKCVQGMVPLKRVRKNEVGGLMVVPKTNNAKTQSEICQRYPWVMNQNSDWIQLNGKDPFIGKGKLVECQAGDLILWDSRTIHGGLICEPSEQFKKENTTDLVRLAFTVTMVPRKWATEEVLKKRMQAFKDRIGTTHWPHEFHKNPMGAMCNGIDRSNITYEWPQLTPQIAKVV